MTTRALLALLLVLPALALSACGGGGDGEAGEAEEPVATETAGEDMGAGGDVEAGAAVFASAGCGGCHVLEEAGSSGTTGPALDGTNLSAAEVEEQVREGGGAMPAFEDQLSDEEIANVTAFVVEASQS